MVASGSGVSGTTDALQQVHVAHGRLHLLRTLLSCRPARLAALRRVRRGGWLKTTGGLETPRCEESNKHRGKDLKDGGVDEGVDEVVSWQIREVDLDELWKDVSLGRAVLSQVLSGTWWDWANGSSLIFWRWNGVEQIRAARDGMHIFIQRPLPRGRKLKQLNLNTEQKLSVAGKLESMVAKAYLEPGFVSNALHFFAVPKGDSDIRVVF